MSYCWFYQGSIPAMSMGLRVLVPHYGISLAGEGSGKCDQSVITGLNCKLKEETPP